MTKKCTYLIPLFENDLNNKIGVFTKLQVDGYQSISVAGFVKSINDMTERFYQLEDFIGHEVKCSDYSEAKKLADEYLDTARHLK